MLDGDWFGPVLLRFSTGYGGNGLFTLGSPACTDLAVLATTSSPAAFVADVPCPSRGTDANHEDIVIAGPYNGFAGHLGLFAPAGFHPDKSTTSEVHVVNPEETPLLYIATNLLPSDDAILSTHLEATPFDGDHLNSNGDCYVIRLGSEDVYDAGVRENDEKYANFFFDRNHMPPNWVEPPGEGTVEPHPGFFGALHGPDANSLILNHQSYLGVKFDQVNADFTRHSHTLATINLHLVPWKTTDAALAEAPYETV